MNNLARMVITQVITDLLQIANSIAITEFDWQPVENGITDIDQAMAILDDYEEARIIVSGPAPYNRAFVYLVWDEPCDGTTVITDYNTVLEPILAKAEALQDWGMWMLQLAEENCLVTHPTDLSSKTPRTIPQLSNFGFYADVEAPVLNEGFNDVAWWGNGLATIYYTPDGPILSFAANIHRGTLPATDTTPAATVYGPEHTLLAAGAINITKLED